MTNIDIVNRKGKPNYEGQPTMFTMKLYHGGRFIKVPENKYVEGKIKYLDDCDIDGFCIHDLDAVMTQLGYIVPPPIYYHFRIPNENLDFGLRALANDDDVIKLTPYIIDNKVIEVYTEHGKSRLLTYYMSPNPKGKVVIEEIMEEDANVGEKVNCCGLYDSVGTEFISEPIGDYTRLLLTNDSEFDFGSPEYRTGGVDALASGSSSAVKKLRLDDLENNSNMNAPQMEDNEQFVEDDYEADLGSDSEKSNDDDILVDVELNVHDVEVDMADFNLYNSRFVDNTEDKEVEEGLEGGVAEDMEVINADQWEDLNACSEEDKRRKRVLKNLGAEKRCNLGEVHKATFYVGMRFKNKKALCEKIDLHSIETRRDIYYAKHDKLRVRAKCRGRVVQITGGVIASTSTKRKRNVKVGGCTSKAVQKGRGKDVNSDGEFCKWFIQASRPDLESDWLIKTMNLNHTCIHSREIRACTAAYMSTQIIDQVDSNPIVPVRSLRQQFQKQYDLGVSMDKAYRAKEKAKNVIAGDYTKQYDLLRDYVLELQATNEDTTVKIDVFEEPNPSCPTRQFRRIYVCLGALKKGYKAGSRDLLGLDGTFMKGPFPGQILTAVGLDSNNGIYPLAYAVVESENLNSWKWFLENLADDLHLQSNSNYTFITDRQKGLLPAIKQMFPSAEHRYCLRHIYDNMRKTWKQAEYKEYLWNCATATTKPEFEVCMRELDQFDREACNWLKQISPEHWARSYFSGRAITEVSINKTSRICRCPRRFHNGESSTGTSHHSFSFLIFGEELE